MNSNLTKQTICIFLLIPTICLCQKKVKQETAWIQELGKQDEIIKTKEVSNYDKKGQILSLLRKNQNGKELVEKNKYNSGGICIESIVIENKDTLLFKTKVETKGNYTEIIHFSANGEKTRKECYYKNNNGKTTEAKFFKYKNEDQKTIVELVDWTFYTYNDKGLLIGSRTKDSYGDSKTIYFYKKGTDTLSSTKTTETSISKMIIEEVDGSLTTEKSINICEGFSEYDSKGRIIREKSGNCSEELTTYHYQNGKIWLIEFENPMSKKKSIYKDGVLVCTKDYSCQISSLKLGEPEGGWGLFRITYYQYEYWQQ